MTAGIVDKQALRHAALSRRATLPVEQRVRAAEAVGEIGLSFLDLPGSTIISAYYPVGEELDVRPLMIRLIGEGHTIGLPITRKDQPLIFRAWTPDTEMTQGSMGIPRPTRDAPEVSPSVLLVPLAAFDNRGYRVGYGGGFYDRTLAKLRASGPVTAVGVAFSEQQVERVPDEPHDERLDWLLTPEGVMAVEAA
jgi:5-formyltetrahydrofolate cyclo-ligase